MKKQKKKLDSKSGITLIALVITIIVLLILAGVSISLVVGDNGVLIQARDTKEKQRYVSVKEQRDIWWSELELDSQTNSSSARKLQDVIDELKDQGLLNSDDADKIKASRIL